MSERSKERRRLAQQQLHDKHETAEQASKLHVLQQLLHKTLLSDTADTQHAFKHAVKDMDITNAYLVHLNTSGNTYSGIAASILHQRKYVEKSYDGEIAYKGQYAGAFTTWDNVPSANLHIDGDFALMHAEVRGSNMFNKARFTGNNILFSAKINCEHFGHRLVVHGHGFCAHARVNVKDGCMDNSKVVGSNCFESSTLHGKSFFSRSKVKGDEFLKKASVDVHELLNNSRIKGNNNLWHCTIKAKHALSNVTIIGNAFANYSKITSAHVFNYYRSFGAHFCRGSNIQGDGMTGYVYGTKDKVLLNGKEVRPVAPRSAYDKWSSEVMENSNRPAPMILQVTAPFMLPVFLVRGIAYITNQARGKAVARRHKDKHL